MSKGYELTHNLKVTTQIPLAATAIKAAVSSGVNNVDRIEFLTSVDAQNTVVAEAMRKATLAAKSKAEKVADGFGVHLGRVLKIEEGGWWIVPSNEPPLDTGSIPSEYANNMIMPQRQAVQMNVNVVFEVK